MQGDDGTDRRALLVGTDGHLQVDVLSGGGETAPSGPTVEADTGSVAAGGTDVLLSSVLNGTEKLTGVDVSASVAFKWEVGFANDGAAISTSYAIGFARAGETVQWRPPHRDYCEVSGDNSDDKWAVAVENMDASQTASIYTNFYYQNN
jgi:hypothetical protein